MGNRYVIKDTSVEELMSLDIDGVFNVPIAHGESAYRLIAKSIVPLPEPKVRLDEESRKLRNPRSLR